MTLCQDIQRATRGLSVPAMLRHLIVEKFPGKIVVTASLRMRSIVVLKMVSDIDPITPVVMCHAGHLFPESRSYRERIVAGLGLTDVRTLHGAESAISLGDTDHYEVIWAESQTGDGRIYQIVHLNQSLAPFACWIRAVYHEVQPAAGRHAIDVNGRLIRVDPLFGWSDDDVRRYMRAHALPFHPRVSRPKPPLPADDQPESASISCHF